MENGRCYRHGGRTPKGDNWHKPVWPDPRLPDAEERLQWKLRSLEKRAAARRRKLKDATAEEIKKHADWQRTHKAGSAAARAKARAERQNSKWLDAILSKQNQESSPAPSHHEDIMLSEITSSIDEAADVESELAHRVRTEGLRVAYETALEVCRDRKAAPAARATASGWLFRVAGFSASNDSGSTKQPYEMTADELAAEATRLSRARERLEAQVASSPTSETSEPSAFD